MLAKLGRRTDQDHHLASVVSSFSLTPSCHTVSEPADSLPPPSATTVAPSKLPPARTSLPGWEDLWNRPSPAPYNLDDDFLPGDGSSLTNVPAPPPLPHTSLLHVYDGDADSDNAPRHLRRRPLRSPVRPRRRMRDFALDPRVRKKKRLVAGCPDATEPTGSPAEGTTEEPMIIVDSVVSLVRSLLCPPCPYT